MTCRRGILVLTIGVAVVLSSVARPVRGAATGTVTGTIGVEGEIPKLPPLPVFKHREVCGDDVPDERLVVGASGGLRYAVVSIEGVDGGRQVERDLTHVLDNVGCRFVPHVQVAEVGQWLEIRNSDPLLHNADAQLGSTTLFNVALPPARRIRKPLARVGLVAFKCNVRHTWMSAFVVVSDHPYHTVTDVYGAYQIDDLPPGPYTLKVWHERLGIVERPVAITAGETTMLDVRYPRPEEGGKTKEGP